MQRGTNTRRNRIRRPRFFGWSMLLAVALGIAAHADTVKLKNGTVLEGTIVAEDDNQITIEVEYAGGTITRTETINKSGVAEVKRLTEEEKAYQVVQKYELNPARSFPLARYDQAINDVFRPFVTRFPDSPHREEVMGKIVLWEAERAQVAAGRAKYRGEWMAAAEAFKLAEQERVEQLLQQGRTLLEQSRYEQAIQQFRAAVSMVKRPDLLIEIRHLQAEAYKLWLESLDRQRQKLTKDVEVYQQEADRARQARSQTEVARWETQLAVLRSRLASVEKEITSVQSRAAKVGVATEVAQAPAPSAPAGDAHDVPPGPAYSPPLWDNIIRWLKNKWVLLAIGLVVLVLFFSRILLGR